jgi:hypothetical protein
MHLLKHWKKLNKGQAKIGKGSLKKMQILVRNRPLSPSMKTARVDLSGAIWRIHARLPAQQ